MTIANHFYEFYNCCSNSINKSFETSYFPHSHISPWMGWQCLFFTHKAFCLSLSAALLDLSMHLNPYTFILSLDIDIDFVFCMLNGFVSQVCCWGDTIGTITSF